MSTTLDAFIKVRQHGAGNGRARHDQISELQAVEPLGQRPIGAVGRHGVKRAGRLRRGEVVGIKPQDEEPVGHSRIVPVLDSHRLDLPLANRQLL